MMLMLIMILCCASYTISQSSPEVVIDGYTFDSVHPSPATLELGATLVLVCRVSGIPQHFPIAYQWTCPNGPCISNSYQGRSITGGNILKVNITSTNDSGIYTCGVSSNQLVNIYQQNYTLNITGGTVVHSFGRLFSQEHIITDRYQILPPGVSTGTGEITCRTSTGSFEIIGVYNLQSLANFGLHEVRKDQTTSLLLQESFLNSSMSIEGFCADAGINYFYLPQIGEPGHVRLLITNTTDQSIKVKVQWQPTVPTNTVIRVIVGYERHDLGVSLPGFYKNIADRSKYTYRSLVPGAKYVLVAQGLTGLQNEIKLTMNVTRTEWKTDEIAPSAPRSVIVTQAYDNWAEVNWIPPLEPNGDVHYIVWYSISVNGTEMRSELNCTSFITYCNLTGLERRVTYNITVAAENSAGNSQVRVEYRHDPVFASTTVTVIPDRVTLPIGLIGGIVGGFVILLLLVVVVIVVVIIFCKKSRKQGKETRNEERYVEYESGEYHNYADPGDKNTITNAVINQPNSGIYEMPSGSDDEKCNGRVTADAYDYVDQDGVTAVLRTANGNKVIGLSGDRSNNGFSSQYSKLNHTKQSSPIADRNFEEDQMVATDQYSQYPNSAMYINSSSVRPETSESNHLSTFREGIQYCNTSSQCGIYEMDECVPQSASRCSSTTPMTHVVDPELLYTQPKKAHKKKKSKHVQTAMKKVNPEDLYTAVNKPPKKN